MSQLNATPAVFAFARYFTRPLCPECNHEQFVPERSAFIDDGNVRHSWLCEVCGHDFCTTVEIGRSRRLRRNASPETAPGRPRAARFDSGGGHVAL